MPSRDLLLAAYRTTTYHAGKEDGVAARVDRHEPALDALLRAHGARTGIFITAWNPRSEPLSREANHAAARQLAEEVAAAGFSALPHHGVGADPTWSEEGLFVLDMDEPAAVALAERHGQNAIVFVAAGEPARLVLTRWMPQAE
jgi:hypothetical protein